MKRQTFKFLPVISAILLLGLFAPIPLCADDIFGDVVKNAADQATQKAIEAVPTLLAGDGKAKSGHPKASRTDAEQASQTQAKSHSKKRVTSSEDTESNDLAGTQGVSPVSALKSVEPFQRFQQASQTVTPGLNHTPVPATTPMSQDPQTGARTLFDQGMAALAHRDPQKAAGFWKDALRVDPGFKAARVALDKLLSRHPDLQ